MMIRLHNIMPQSKALGPCTRCIIWLQGCPRFCDGCMSPNSRPIDGGTLVPLDVVFTQIATIPDIEGITISGGEPFIQVDALHTLLFRIKQETKLGSIIYTGYYRNELEAMHNPKVDEILTELLDILIDGPYDNSLNDGISLRGSSNQTVHYLTKRYLPYQRLYEEKSRKVELHMESDVMQIVGVPSKETLSTWGHIITNGN